ncbi:hypothetical protein B0H19DRAFT_1086051 [Mycena capillaripes]|nr:hypothetical protein B0H19DRAFT_1086051 [Mycena capillaripes]
MRLLKWLMLRKIMELIIQEQQQWIQRVLLHKNKMLDTMIEYTPWLMPYWRTFDVDWRRDDDVSVPSVENLIHQLVYIVVENVDSLRNMEQIFPDAYITHRQPTAIKAFFVKQYVGFSGARKTKLLGFRKTRIFYKVQLWINQLNPADSQHNMYRAVKHGINQDIHSLTLGGLLEWEAVGYEGGGNPLSRVRCVRCQAVVLVERSGSSVVGEGQAEDLGSNRSQTLRGWGSGKVFCFEDKCSGATWTVIPDSSGCSGTDARGYESKCAIWWMVDWAGKASRGLWSGRGEKAVSVLKVDPDPVSWFPD